jgi:hypothetical protein
MEKDTKSLFKGAASLLSDGASLVTPPDTGHELEAKDAIKGFMRSGNQSDMKNEKDQKVSTNDNIKTPSEKKHNDPFKVSPPFVKKEIATAKSEMKPTNEKLDSNKKTPAQSTVRKALQKQGYSIFEMYLVALNVFLSLGILYTIYIISSAAYSLHNPGSTLTLDVAFQLAKNVYDEQTPIIIEHCRKNLTSIVQYFENSPKHLEETIAMIKTFFMNSPKYFEDTIAMARIHFENSPKYFEDTIAMIKTHFESSPKYFDDMITMIKTFYPATITFINQCYEKMLISVSSFYVYYMIPVWETLFDQISEIYEDFSQTMETIST